MQLNHETEMDGDVSWFFNDINLTMVMLILFFAVIFATMVSQGSTQSAQTDTTEQSRMPTELSSDNFFGETGFPQANQEKGFPTKETFNSDLIISDNNSDREGMVGNRVWEFEQLSTIKNKKILEIQVNELGKLQYENKNYSYDDFAKFIDKQAETLHVFVQVQISENASVKIYEKLRNELWNKSNATHWQFSTAP